MVVVHSRAISLLDDLELRTVLGHEAGHILSDHVLYITALRILIALSQGMRLPFIAGLPLRAMMLALLEWYRAAELSVRPRGDARQPRPADHLPHADGARRRRALQQLNLDAFVQQANDYEEWSSGWDKMIRMRIDLCLTHSRPVKRVKEIMAWVQSGEYDRIVSGEFPTRDQQADARKEAGEAYEHYKERFRRIFSEFAPTTWARRSPAHRARSPRAGNRRAAEKVADWLKPKPRDER